MLLNLLLAKDMAMRELPKIAKYVLIAGIQLTLFYGSLGLSLAFALIPEAAQVMMIVALPLFKTLIKHVLWKYARELDNISTDVTVCMVEISCSLYQAVCLQLVNSILLEVMIMLMDLIQAAIEARTFMGHDYISDGRTTIQTATNIVRSSVFPGATERPRPLSPRDPSVNSRRRSSVIQSLASLHLSFRHSVSSPQRLVTQGQTLGGSKVAKNFKSKRGTVTSLSSPRQPALTDSSLNTAAAAQITKKTTSCQMRIQFRTECSVSPPVCNSSTFAPKRYAIAVEEPSADPPSQSPNEVVEFHGPLHKQSVVTRANSERGGDLAIIKATGKGNGVLSRGALPHTARSSLPPTRGSSRVLPVEQHFVAETDTPVLGEAKDSHANDNGSADIPAKRAMHHPFIKSAASRPRAMINGITVQRRDQARILEQMLQLLFSYEVLLFVEYMEVFMSLLYGVCWNSTNAKCDMLVMAMTHSQMVINVVNVVVYAFLESFAFVIMCWFMEKKYGISTLYQFALMLENYWMTLHSKLMIFFVTILNSATIHHGLNFSLKFDFEKLMDKT